MLAAHKLFDLGDYTGAASAYRLLISTAPSPGLWVNLGYSQLEQQDYAAASVSFDQALSLDPGFAPALVGLGDTASRRGDHNIALEHYDAALIREPTLAVAHNNRAQALFAVGRTVEAWEESEWRFNMPDRKNLYPHSPAQPRWRGEVLPDNLLVHWEQGFGDIIQHLRFLPTTGDRVPGIYFECPPPLLRLMNRLPLCRIIEASAESATQVSAETNFSASIPLLSLPHLLGLDLTSIPLPPYLYANFEHAQTLRSHWQQAGKILVGIAWRGSNFDPHRNALLSDFANLAEGPMRLISIQKDVDASEIELIDALNGIDTSSLLADFAATADVIEAVDVVICVDTAVAHLAGAIGKPTILLLNEPAATRWMLNREDTPWYPSMRLLRKNASGAWRDLVRRAGKAAGARV